MASFEKGLAEGGYVENRNVAFEFRWADGRAISPRVLQARSGPANEASDEEVSKILEQFPVSEAAETPSSRCTARCSSKGPSFDVGHCRFSRLNRAAPFDMNQCFPLPIEP